MPKDSIVYHSLSPDQDYPFELLPIKQPTAWPRRIFILITFLSLALNLYFTRWLSERGPASPIFPQALYSPAQEALSYKAVKFHSGFGSNLPIYDRPPSNEVDEAWEDLYRFAVSKIPKSQAARLTNKTWPILGDENQYMVAIDVFHELHCLNLIRKALYPEYYQSMNNDTDGLDISTIVWQWSERSQSAKERADVAHTCRDFDKIRDWAEQHNFPHPVDMTVYIEDDIEIPAL